MLSFSAEAAEAELGLLIKKGHGLLSKRRLTVSEVDVILRAEADWLRETYDTLTLVFQKNTQANTLLEMGPRHLRGSLSSDIGSQFEQRMKNRLSLLERLRTQD